MTEGVEYAPGEPGERQDPRRRKAMNETALAARIRAALKLLSPDHITPMGARIIEKVLDAEEEKKKS